MAPKYKLSYFNISGRAEPIRYIFGYANQSFEDNRIQREQWKELKPRTPFGSLPILEVDGKVVNQSTAIGRYLAKQFNLTGKDEWEALQADVLVDTVGDYNALEMKKFREKDEEKLAAIEKDQAFFLEKFNKIISDNPSGYLVGSQVTWADLVFSAALSGSLDRSPDLLKSYPGLAKLVATIKASPNLKAYLETRPKFDSSPPGPPPKR